jgi:hypothetical protein
MDEARTPASEEVMITVERLMRFCYLATILHEQEDPRPSGLPIDLTRWRTCEPSPNMTLALPKQGLRASGVEVYVGELYLADISVPPGLYAEPGLALSVRSLFAHDDVICLR